MAEAPSPRSWLYVPGDREDVLAKAFTRGADALILDLEDAVASGRKALARDLVAGCLRARASASEPAGGDLQARASASEPVPAPPAWVRVSAAEVAADVRAVAGPGLAGIVLAKAERDLLAHLDEVLTAADAATGRSAPTPVVALIETARGLADVAAIARAPRVRNLALGEADLTAELGVDPAEAPAVTAIRMPLVLASAAAGLPAPTGPTSTDYRDLAALRASTEALVRQGFRARSAIHPAQVAVINDVLTPSAADVAAARRSVAAFEEAGGGAAIGGDGTMIDAATIRAARDVLARARAAALHDDGRQETL